jgi:hypothetical protein
MLIPYIIIYGPSINLKNLLLIDVYESRTIQTEFGNLYTSYSYSFLTKFLLPTLLVIFIIKGKLLQVFFLALAFIFLFLCGAHKAVLFSLFLLFIFYFFKYEIKIRYFLLSIIVILLLSQISYLLFDNVYVEGLIIQRTFFLNSLLDIYYFQEFLDKPIYWSDSFLKSFIDYPHSVEPAYLIGAKYFDSPEMQANNGIISDGFMNFGFMGIMINSFLFCILLVLVKSMKISHHFFGVFVILLIAFRNSALSTSLLTHGIVLFIFYCQFSLRGSNSLD